MAYSELIKDFGRIRDYMRQFYVYGFKSREEYDKKSARSYDNERRRIESWLGDYMAFRRNSEGKQVFLSVDSRAIPHNPFFTAFKAKSFTDKDITLHFYILDVLQDHEALSVGEILDRIEENYLSHFDGGFSLDESTLRKKLKEYCELGILEAGKRGRETTYAKVGQAIDLDSWKDALAYFSEVSPLGIMGSTIADKQNDLSEYFSFKHHYLLHAMDSEVICNLFAAMREKKCVDLEIISLRSGKQRSSRVYPMKIYISSQSGREYLLCYLYKARNPVFYRLDSIAKATPGPEEHRYEVYDGYGMKLAENLWGVSVGAEHSLDHIELTIHIEDDEAFIVQRLEREKRVGQVEIVDEHTVKFSADIYDADEMLPWLRTFIGRIEKLECSNRYVTERFYKDLQAMKAIYSEEPDPEQREEREEEKHGEHLGTPE